MTVLLMASIYQVPHFFGRLSLGFLAQQVGEKAVKAIHYARGERIVYGHSIYDLFKRLKLKDKDAGALLQIAGSLDQFYIPARYPNGLPEGS